MKTAEVTVAQKHFDEAMAWVKKRGDKNVVQHCLIAQAIKGAFPNHRVEVSTRTASVKKIGSKVGRNFDLPLKINSLILQFDALAYVAHGDRTGDEEKELAKVRKSLPVTFRMKEMS